MHTPPSSTSGDTGITSHPASPVSPPLAAWVGDFPPLFTLFSISLQGMKEAWGPASHLLLMVVSGSRGKYS